MSKILFLSPYGMIISGLQAFFLVFLIIYIYRKEGKLAQIGYTALFIYMYLVFLLQHALSFGPLFPDAVLYFELISQPSFYSDSSISVYIYSSFLNYLTIGGLIPFEVIMTLSIFFSVMAVDLIWKSSIILYSDKYLINEKRGLFIYLLTVSLYPAFVIFSTIPLREWASLLGFALLYRCLSLIYLKDRHWSVYWSFAVIFLFIARPYTLAIAFIVPILMMKNKLFKLTCTFLMGLSIFFVLPLISPYRISPEFLALLRNGANESHDNQGTYGIVQWDSFSDIFLDLPLLISQFLLAPLPILISKLDLNSTLYILDSLFVSFVLIISLRYVFSHKVILIFMIVTVSIFSIWEFHIGGAVRHRLILIMIIISISSIRCATVKRFNS